MKSKMELQADIEAEVEKAQAINDLAQEEGRDLTPIEARRWESIIGKNGTIEKAKKALDAYEQKNERNAALALQNSALRKVHSATPFAQFQNTNSDMELQMSTAYGNTPQEEPRLRSKKLRAFANERDAYDSGQWLKGFLARSRGGYDEAAEQHVAARGWQIMATATEGTPSAGGYLVPSPLSNAIIDVREFAGVSRSLCRVMPMTSDTLDVAKKTAGVTVYYPGEAGAITASDQTWGSVNLNAKKRAILSYISQELNDDSVIPVMDDLASQMGLDLAIQEDNELINGDGTSTYGNVSGLVTEIGSAGTQDATSGSDLWTELAMVDFTNTMSLLQSKYWARGANWLCSSQFYYSVMLNLMADAGGNSLGSIEQGQLPGIPMFLGAPVIFSAQMPTTTAASTIACYFGSFSDGVMIGDRLGVRIAQSDQYAFDTDRLAIRATSRYDIVCHDVGNATDAGAIVALKTAA